MEWFIRYIRFNPAHGLSPNRDGAVGVDDKAPN